MAAVVVGFVVTPVRAGHQLEALDVVTARLRGGPRRPGGDLLVAWAENLSSRAARRSRGRLRFAFHGRVSTEDWQDPVTSRAWKLQQAAMLVAGHGVIVA